MIACCSGTNIVLRKVRHSKSRGREGSLPLDQKHGVRNVSCRCAQLQSTWPCGRSIWPGLLPGGVMEGLQAWLQPDFSSSHRVSGDKVAAVQAVLPHVPEVCLPGEHARCTCLMRL